MGSAPQHKESIESVGKYLSLPAWDQQAVSHYPEPCHYLEERGEKELIRGRGFIPEGWEGLGENCIRSLPHRSGDVARARFSPGISKHCKTPKMRNVDQLPSRTFRLVSEPEPFIFSVAGWWDVLFSELRRRFMKSHESPHSLPVT